MYTCIVIDDQKESVELLVDHISKTPQLELKKASTDPIEALAFLDKEKVDIILLDVQMPELSGLELIDNLKSKWGNDMPKIILTTGYNEYAIPGFESGVKDYLLKPIVYSRFRKAIDRIMYELEQYRGQTVSNDFIFAENDGKKLKINFCDITYVEGARNYIIIATDKQKIITYRSMNSLQSLLPREQFMRVHKSYIISVSKIQAVRGHNIFVQFRDDSKSIPIGVTFRENVLRQLNLN
jgi:two-component system LytT family response regulator